MKVILAVILISTFAIAADGPQPDRWHGLVLNTSTPADVTELGKPSSDKLDKLTVLPDTGKLLDQDLFKKTALRRLEFKAVEGFRSVDLFFRSDKLVAVLLTFSKPLNTEALKNIYGMDFNAYIGGSAVSGPHPGGFPLYYSLVGLAETSIVNAYVDNNPLGIGAMLKGRQAGGFPGTVAAVMLISRKLEDHTGSDLLK